jgi:hypothetical protein
VSVVVVVVPVVVVPAAVVSAVTPAAALVVSALTEVEVDVVVESVLASVEPLLQAAKTPSANTKSTFFIFSVFVFVEFDIYTRLSKR